MKTNPVRKLEFEPQATFDHRWNFQHRYEFNAVGGAHVVQQIGPVQPLTLFYRSPKARATLLGSRRRLNHGSRELPFHRFAIVFLNRRPGGEFHGMEKQRKPEASVLMSRVSRFARANHVKSVENQRKPEA